MPVSPPSSHPIQPSGTPWSVAATLRIYRLLLGFYPRGFRVAYEADVLQVFRQCCGDAYRERGTAGVMRLWLPAIADLFIGAVADYCGLVVEAWRRSMSMDRARSSAITVFCAYIAFVLAGMGFQKLSEYDDFTDAAKAHTLIGVSFNVILYGSAVALLAVLVGGLPLAFAALRSALSARRVDILLLFAVPVVAFGALIGYGAIAKALSGGEKLHLGFLGLIGVLILGAIASTAAVSLAVKRSQIGGKLMYFSRIPATVATLAMLAMCLATIAWGLGLRSNVPQLYNGNDGLVATNTAVNWLSIVAVMTIATVIAGVGVVRSFNTGQRVSTTAA
ncbi:MAG: hypothetical protein ACXWP6_04300 [Ktedonobacterales bacterium]